MKFFTSDTHFGQERALTLSMRPFDSVDEMDITIIKNINDVLSTGEDPVVLYHLGDFGDYNRVREINAPVILIVGNYEEKEYGDHFDEWSKEILDKYGYDGKTGFLEIWKPIKKISIEYTLDDKPNPVYRKELMLAHKPLDIKKVLMNDFERGLFGHIHGRQKVKKFGIDVGVDAQNFKPISENDVGFYLNAIDKFYDDDVFC